MSTESCVGKPTPSPHFQCCPDKIEVRCDSCSEEYSFKPKTIMRDEVQVPESFMPHPLFKA
jgi:hypothetical protein